MGNKVIDIPIYKITHWYHEGRQGFGKDNVNFFKQLKGLEKINQTKKPVDNLEIKEKTIDKSDIVCYFY